MKRAHKSCALSLPYRVRIGNLNLTRLDMFEFIPFLVVGVKIRHYPKWRSKVEPFFFLVTNLVSF
jgi:hypothetical protein